MALTGINFAQTESFVSEYDQDTENPTTFELGMLDNTIQTHIDNESVAFKSSSKKGKDPAIANILMGTKNYLTVRFGVKNIDNFLHPDTGDAIPFKTQSVPFGHRNYNAVASDIMNLIPREVISELSNRISELNDFKEGERKN